MARRDLPRTEPKRARILFDPDQEWAEGEGIPIHLDFGHDLIALETAVWDRYGARGCFAHIAAKLKQAKGRKVMQQPITLISLLALGLAACLAAPPACAADILTEWSSVKIPPPPEPKKVTIDPKTTALLVFDLMKSNCGERPRCPPIVPNVKRLLDQARAHNMLVAYTLVGTDRTPNGMVDPSLRPREGEHIIENAHGGDKFAESSLNPVLKAHGIKTVIITGTSFQGAVATSANGATELGYHALVPVDTTASENAFNELYAAWHVAKGGPAAFTRNATLTRSDLIDFGK